jgi:hypothetical protein
MHDAGMPRATLTFRLPDEESEFRDAVEGQRAKCIVMALDEHLREQIKGDELSHEIEVAFQELREWLRSECADHGLDLL